LGYKIEKRLQARVIKPQCLRAALNPLRISSKFVQAGRRKAGTRSLSGFFVFKEFIADRYK